MVKMRRPWPILHLVLLPLLAATDSSPPPVRNLNAADITTSSITITFTEDEHFATEITCNPPIGTLVNPGNLGNRTFRGLDAGQIYSFVGVTVDPDVPDRRSSPVAIIQDTVPPQPEGLELSTFEVLTVEVTFFGSKVPHRIDTSGILAEWSPPGHGNCDCYQASIGPNEGLQIEPKDEGGELNPGEKSRQFIHLVPGKEYEVEIWSTTCGNGASVGPLLSEKLSTMIRVPPQSPGRVRQKERGGDFVEMCFQGPTAGHFTGFEISWQSNDGNTGTEQFDVHGHSEEYAYEDYDRNYCYTLEGLRSCTPHQVQIKTIYEGAKSTDNTRSRFETLPQAPINVQLKNYEDDSIELLWDNPGDSLGYTVNVKPSDANYTITNPGFRMEGLQAGQRNDFEIKSYCLMSGDRKGTAIEYKLFSNAALFSQTTVPEAPPSATGLCRVGKSSVDLQKDDTAHFAATVMQEIILDLEWDVPSSGIWDGFIVTYSPFVTNPTDDSYIPPFSFPAGRTKAKINLPRTDQQYTVYIRSIAGNIESEPLIVTVDCGEPAPVLSCTQKPAQLHNIDLNSGNVEINLDHLALSDNLWGNMFSADDPFGPRLEFGGRGGKTIIIRSDNMKCNEIECESIKLGLKVCTAGFGCQERFTASACPCSNPDKQVHVPSPDDVPNPINPRNHPRPGHVMADACCGTKLYNSEDKVCCHDELFEKDGSDMCCGRQKYDKKLYQCCGSDAGFGIAFVGASCNDATFLPGKKY